MAGTSTYFLQIDIRIVLSDHTLNSRLESFECTCFFKGFCISYNTVITLLNYKNHVIKFQLILLNK